MSLAATIDSYSSAYRSPSFTRTVTVSDPFTKGSFPLYFYLPKSHSHSPEPASTKFPVVVNFHGGGYTLGDARDDTKWAAHIADTLNAVVVSVGYRKAPDYPYPIPVQDGALALHYLASHAAELNLDISRVITSGFSAGGNLCLTSPLLYSVLQSSSAIAALDPAYGSAIPTDFDPETLALENGNRCNVLAAASFYPGLDYSLTRAQRTATNPRPDQNVSEGLYKLFDFSYLPVRAEEQPDAAVLKSPFLSPARASGVFLKEHLPRNVLILTCEWDMLQREGEEFVGMLNGVGMGVRGRHVKVERVAHGWDKMPAVMRRGEEGEWAAKQVEVAYGEAGGWLKGVLEGL